ncbi:MAG: cation:proton antiporter [Novosphingobium sp.]
MTEVASFSPTSPLGDALVILGAAGIVIPLFARIRITPVIGFIVVGILVGPYGLGGMVRKYDWLSFLTISDPAGLMPFADFGIVLLLFSVGLELSFGRLWQMRRQVFGLGALEMLLGAGLIALGLMALGNSPATAMALGLALALSSTALVLRITDQNTPVGRAALSMLLFEDIALVPIIFLLGAMGRGPAVQDTGEIFQTLLLGFAAIVGLLILGRVALPGLFALAARTKSPELFLAASLLVVIVASLITGAAGLSPIVGALIAGLAIAETEYHGEVEIMTAPFKGLALGIFLIVVGMGLDLGLMVQHWSDVLAAVVLVLISKAVVTGLLLRLMGARPGTSTETGILMASPSETTLIVLSAAVSVRLINADAAQFWQLVTAIGLTVTPLLAIAGRRLGRRVDRAMPRQEHDDPGQARAIIVGSGRVGRMVADMLTVHGQAYVAIDSDADLIANARRSGYKAVFGDAGRGDALARLGVEKATAAILTMDDPVGVQRIVRRLRRQYPELPIIARARDATHAAALYRAGASHAVPEALEASLQLSEAVLVDLGVAMGPVIASIHEKRDELRAQIMAEGELAQMPKLKSASLRDRAN